VPSGRYNISDETLVAWLFNEHLPCGPFVRDDLLVARLRINKDNLVFPGLVICRYTSGTVLLQGRNSFEAMSSIDYFTTRYLNSPDMQALGRQAPPPSVVR
jgi:hypothetical protein